MKIGIMADSHDNLPKIEAAVDVFNQQAVDLVIHAGDLIAPFTADSFLKLQAQLVAVFGNNDGEVLGLDRRFEGRIHKPPYLLLFHDLKILICHEPVAFDILTSNIFYDAIIYGHTHEHDVQGHRPWIINPGETCGWLTGFSTVAIWDVTQDHVDIIPL